MTRLRDNFDATQVPIDSSAVHRVDVPSKTDEFLFELEPNIDTPWEGVEEPTAQTDFERRKGRRRSPPKTGISIRVQRWLNTLVYKIHGSRKYQIIFAAVPLAALALITFSATVRINEIDGIVADTVTLGELEAEIAALRAEWPESALQAIHDRLLNADQRRVFADYRGLAAWITEKDRFAEQLGLEFSYRLGEERASSIDNMNEVPIELTLAGSETSNQTYLHVLEFLRRLLNTPYYVEIIETSLIGAGDGAKSVNAVLRVWVHTEVTVDGETP
ncbi:MAG: hypothetical protein AAGC71_07990 [Pseudomonadota bacterium]